MILLIVEKIDYPSANVAGRRLMDFGDLNMDIFLEINIEMYS